MQHEHQRCQLNSNVTTCSSQSFDASMEANPKEQVLFSCKHSDEDEVLASAASEGENAKVCCLFLFSFLIGGNHPSSKFFFCWSS